jgi:hypothetical protein
MMLTQQIVCREIGQYSVNCENISGYHALYAWFPKLPPTRCTAALYAIISQSI